MKYKYTRKEIVIGLLNWNNKSSKLSAEEVIHNVSKDLLAKEDYKFKQKDKQECLHNWSYDNPDIPFERICIKCKRQELRSVSLFGGEYCFGNWTQCGMNELLAQKEDRKEWKPCDCPKGGIDGDGMVCDKCGGTEWVKVKSTPSPLEIEEIEKIKRMIVYPDICEDLAKVVKEIVENQNTLIHNQKKLYQYIKEKL